MDCGHCHIARDAIRNRNWTHSLVFLIGCETAAADATEGNLAEAFLSGGARAVIGTLMKIPVNVAAVFFEALFGFLQSGTPADYAFFFARKKAVLFEALSSQLGNDEGKQRVEEVLSVVDGHANADSMNVLLSELGEEWEALMEKAPTSLGITMLGGGGERLV